VLNELHQELHPDKTFIGRISRGFDFLGYRFAPTLTGMAQVTQFWILDFGFWILDCEEISQF
jgi:hypothetical protein